MSEDLRCVLCGYQPEAHILFYGKCPAVVFRPTPEPHPFYTSPDITKLIQIVTRLRPKETYMDGSTVRPILVYLSGPMTGIPEFNGPAFRAYAAKLRAEGFEVISPHEMDKAADTTGWKWGDFLTRDMDVLLSSKVGVQRIYMMPGWEKSRGAKLERYAAEANGIAVYDVTTMELETKYAFILVDNRIPGHSALAG